jgi:predicted nucleotidyltransferase
MNGDDIITILRAHETELRAAGIPSLSLVGSFARGDEHDASDIDVVARLTDDLSGMASAISDAWKNSRAGWKPLSRPTDIITEPVRNERLRREITQDRKVAFHEAGPAA